VVLGKRNRVLGGMVHILSGTFQACRR